MTSATEVVEEAAGATTVEGAASMAAGGVGTAAVEEVVTTTDLDEVSLLSSLPSFSPSLSLFLSSARVLIPALAQTTAAPLSS